MSNAHAWIRGPTERGEIDDRQRARWEARPGVGSVPHHDGAVSRRSTQCRRRAKVGSSETREVANSKHIRAQTLRALGRYVVVIPERKKNPENQGAETPVTV